VARAGAHALRAGNRRWESSLFILRVVCTRNQREELPVRIPWTPRAILGLCGAVFWTQVHAAQPPAAPIVPPVPIQRADAVYPVGAASTIADVTLAVEVGGDGKVRDVQVVQSRGASFDDAAVAAARQWTFTPATRGGMPIASRIRLSFHFEPPAVAPVAQPAPAAPPVLKEGEKPIEVQVQGRRQPPSRGASDYQLELGALAAVPRQNAAEFLKLAPGILLTNEGGEAHAEQVFLRGFDAREGQDIEFTVDGVPINESGNLHGNGYADTHFIIPELIQSLRVLEGPLDPRQGNYAVAGSADYHLGLTERGLTGKFSVGNYDTYRALLMFAPPHASEGTFAAAELYQTGGFGQNRDGRRAAAIAQYEGGSGATHYRLFAQAYLASFHTAGVLRDDDYRAGRKGFYDTYDPNQGEDSQRYSAAVEVTHKIDHLTFENLVFGIVRPLRLRENFTGFLLDVQEPLQSPHGQRGDLIDLNVMAGTVGLRGAARLTGVLLHQSQELELGYYARGDFGSGVQQRLEAATHNPYKTDTNQDFRLGDIGLYGDLNLRPLRWLALRGGLRGDVFTYDVHNNCAVQSVEHPARSRPLYDASCLDQEGMGMHREPDQRASTQSAVLLPRAAVVMGPLWGISLSGAVGQGVRSIDPIYITQDAQTPFASVLAYEGGLTFQRRFGQVIEVSARSTVFVTKVDRDLIFSQTAGRNTLAGPTSRVGSASSVRLVGRSFDLGANLTYVRATFDDTGLLVPYIPDLVLRADGTVFGELPWRWTRWRGKPVRAALAAGVTYVGPRPLPYGERSDTIFTLDANATLKWWLFEVGIAGQNLTDNQYRQGEYNYASDFHSQSFPTLVPVRHFTAGAPLTVLFTLAVHYGDRK
jgi:TonB family protein